VEFGGRIQGDFPHVDAADYSKKDQDLGRVGLTGQSRQT
jgi:hypothetical protein